jgi:hypothetical protein
MRVYGSDERVMMGVNNHGDGQEIYRRGKAFEHASDVFSKLGMVSVSHCRREMAICQINYPVFEHSNRIHAQVRVLP